MTETKGNFRRPTEDELLEVQDFIFDGATKEQLFDLAESLGIDLDISMPPDLIRWKLRRLQYK